MIQVLGENYYVDLDEIENYIVHYHRVRRHDLEVSRTTKPYSPNFMVLDLIHVLDHAISVKHLRSIKTRP